MRELSIQALLNMEGQQVIVNDIAYDRSGYLCTVIIKRDIRNITINKHSKIVRTALQLVSEEALFEYDLTTGQCINGDFKVYTKD